MVAFVNPETGEEEARTLQPDAVLYGAERGDSPAVVGIVASPPAPRELLRAAGPALLEAVFRGAHASTLFSELAIPDIEHATDMVAVFMPGCIIAYAVDDDSRLHEALDAHDFGTDAPFALPPRERNRYLGTIYAPRPETAHQAVALQHRLDAACADFRKVLGFYEGLVSKTFDLRAPDVGAAWQAGAA